MGKNHYLLLWNWMALIYLLKLKCTCPLHKRIILPSLVENWPCDSGEEDFKHLQCIFCYFLIIYPWKKVLHINKFELPLPKYALIHVWLKLAESFSKKIFCQCIFTFSFVTLLLKKKIESPSLQDAF